MPTRTQLAVPLTHIPPQLATQAQAARSAGATLVELRVDLIGDELACEALLNTPHASDYILTVRSAAEGGGWDGDDADRIALIERLGLLQPGYVDVELAVWQRSANLRQKVGLVCDTGTASPRVKNRLIVSEHDFEHTPADLAGRFAALAEAPSAVLKGAYMTLDATDAFRILQVLRELGGQRDVIALGMGEAGKLTRILAPKFGGLITFAALDADSESAPGQPTLAELREVYDWPRIGPSTKVFGVVGWPVKHSRGPNIHNAAMIADEIDGVYVHLPVGPEYADFARFMGFIRSAPWLDVWGLSVTIPHKEHALRWLRENGFEISSLAARCGAVNTLSRREDDTWAGDNTDCRGVLEALASVPGYETENLAGRKAIMLGAGGAARAAVAALVESGVAVEIYNIIPEQGEQLAQEMGCAHRPWDERGHADGDLLLNCTSVGMSPEVDQTPYPSDAHRAGRLVFDAVYTPAETRLLREAAEAGGTAVSGEKMFIGQALAQYRTWHGRGEPEPVMRRVLAQLLSQP